MATASAGIRGGVNIPLAKFPPPTDTGVVDAATEVGNIVTKLNASFGRQTVQDAAQLFAPTGYWRDHLVLSWSFRTLQGPASIAQFLRSSASQSRDGFRLKKIEIDDSTSLRKPQSTKLDGKGTVPGIQAFLRLQTAIGTGDGVIRLTFEHGKWKIYSLYTHLLELTGYEEGTYSRRPRGVDHSIDHDQASGLNWADRRAQALNFEDGSEPAVVIVGAGHAGLTAAARLKMLGITALVIDQNQRVGDNWRKRYHQLVLHDPVWYDHMPYLPFPPQWPVFTPKDKFGDWLEGYASAMELNVWTGSELSDASWSDAESRWTVQITREASDGSLPPETRVFHPRHIIQATGQSGQKYLPTVPGMDTFVGKRLCHSSEFYGAEKDGKGLKAVVVGSCNSGHDIAQEFVAKGYDVTMVQRSSTTICSSYAITDIAFKGLYCEDGPPVDDADLLVHSMPNSLQKSIFVEVTEAQRKHDKDILDGLERAGFKVNFGPDQAGLFFAYLQHGGGYYIDVGASKLIVEGRIKIKQGEGVTEVLPHGVRLADGSELTADEVIFATGYQSMNSLTRQIFGDEVADRVTETWGFNEEGECRTVWQRSGHPGFWYHGGNIAFCRYFSRLLALQIKGLEEDLYKYDEV